MAKLSTIAKSFQFSKVVEKNDLPAYVRQYIKNEQVLTSYKTKKDYGVFTDNKIVLFDNKKDSKKNYTIPYKSISSLSVVFGKDSSQLNLYLNSGDLVNLKFINMSGTDKLRLRVLYTCMDKITNNQEPIQEDMNNLINNTVKL